MVTFLSRISNACHSLSGVAERLQHTIYFTLIDKSHPHNIMSIILLTVKPITIQI